LERTQHELETKFGRQATDDEIAERMGITRRELDGLQQKVRGSSVLSLEEHLPNERGSDIPLLDTLKGEHSDLGTSLEQHEIKATLIEAVEGLTPQEKTVIKLYYFEGQTLKEIKASLGVSESRVSQIHAQAVIHLRQRLKVLREDLGFRENDPTIKQKYVRKPPASGMEVVG
jgi:RNA polymerase sigma factor for flagellar operon FliA